VRRISWKKFSRKLEIENLIERGDQLPVSL
jgi:hypothetical protein